MTAMRVHVPRVAWNAKQSAASLLAYLPLEFSLSRNSLAVYSQNLCYIAVSDNGDFITYDVDFSGEPNVSSLVFQVIRNALSRAWGTRRTQQALMSFLTASDEWTVDIRFVAYDPVPALVMDELTGMW